VSSVEAQIEAEQISLWFHLAAPLDNHAVYQMLIEGLAAAKADWRAALAARHDHRAAELLAEVVDLTELCAAAAEGLALQRARSFAQGKPWPLARLR
jgi:hypothetical protein